MSSEKPNFNPNATMQLDKVDLEQVQFVDPALPEEAAKSKTPPPLPPSAALPPSAQPSAAPAHGSTAAPLQINARLLAYGAGFVALLVVAIAAGLMVGSRVRSTPEPAPAPAASAAAPPAAVPSASASAPTRSFTLPTIEVNGP